MARTCIRCHRRSTGSHPPMPRCQEKKIERNYNAPMLQRSKWSCSFQHWLLGAIQVAPHWQKNPAVLHQHPMSLERPRGERPHHLHAAKHRWSARWTCECGWALITTICARHLPSNDRRWMKNREGNEKDVRSLRKWMKKRQIRLATVGH